MTSNPEVSYDAEMPDEARARFEAFMETLLATPDVMRKILDTYATNDELVEAAQIADPDTETGRALSLFGQVIENGDDEYVNPDPAFHREIDRIFDRAEQYSNKVDRPRTWFAVLVAQAQNAKITATTGRIPIAPLQTTTESSSRTARASGRPAVTLGDLQAPVQAVVKPEITPAKPMPVEPAIIPAVAAETKLPEVLPAPEAVTTAIKPEVAPTDDKHVEIRLEPPTGTRHRATPAILFAEPAES